MYPKGYATQAKGHTIVMPLPLPLVLHAAPCQTSMQKLKMPPGHGQEAIAHQRVPNRKPLL